MTPKKAFTEIRKRCWRRICSDKLLENVKCRLSNVERPVENDDLRFWAVLNRSNKIYEFLKRDEEKSIRQMELFAFWIRFRVEHFRKTCFCDNF